MGKIIVVGTGYEAKQLTLEAAELLTGGARVILHTCRCGCADWLKEKGIAFESLDALYEQSEDFDEHAELAAQAVCDAAESGDVVYGVFDVRDRSVGALLRRSKAVCIVAGPPIEGALWAHVSDSVQVLEASDWENYALSSAYGAMIREMDSRELASEVKLKLMEVYPEESEVAVRLGTGVARTKLYNLDRLSGYDHRTCVWVPGEPELQKLERFGFDRFCQVIDILCGPDGCPWDREQTHETLRPYVVEEAYEVVGAIDEEDEYHLCDELGDLLLQVVLHAQIAQNHGEFGIADVISAISEKMIRRHSHIFGKDQAEDADSVGDLWAKNKMAERGEITRTESMRSVSKSMPAAMRAAKIIKRLDQVLHASEKPEKLLSAVLRSVEVLNEGSEKEVGEALLCLIAFARTKGVDPELALNAAADRLIERFAEIEHRVPEDGAPEELRSELLENIGIW